MALRLAEVFLPEKGDGLLDELKNQFDIIDSYYACGDGGISVVPIKRSAIGTFF